MRMALQQTGRSDFHKLRLFPQGGQIFRPAVAHTSAHTAQHLVDSISHRAFVGNAALNALRHQLAGVLLEVTVFGALLHRRQGTHTAIHLEATALVNFHLAGAFLGTGQQAAHHHTAAASRQRLHNIAGIFNTTVANNRHVIFCGHLGRIHNCGQLRHANAGNHTRGTN